MVPIQILGGIALGKASAAAVGGTRGDDSQPTTGYGKGGDQKTD